jgi:glycosyltransferase involved in cell wall biosynthesis
MSASPKSPTILTNMAFWQSPAWMRRVDSIYKLDPARGDPDFMPWWREAWTLFRRGHSYNVVLTMGIRESFAYAALARLFGTRAKQIMCEVFIDQPADSPLWRLKTAFYRLLARDAIGYITNSQAEIYTNSRRFGVPASRFIYVPLNSTIEEPAFAPAPEGYLFCAGRTLRDYDALYKVMVATDLPWQVVGGSGALAGAKLPDRIIIHREIDRARYLELLRGARIVVLPLLPTERATGQVVLLEAMSLGKPCITTRAPGTVDIVRDGENGLLVESGDIEGMAARLRELIADPARAERLGRAALEHIQTHATTARHTELRLQAIESLYAAAHAAR